MKKIFILAAVAALTLSSCGNKTQGGEQAADSTEVTAADSTALSQSTEAKVTELTATLQKALESGDQALISSTLTELSSYYKTLVDEGKLDEAKAYGEQVKQWINDNAETVKSACDNETTISELVNTVKSLPTDASATAEDVAAAIKALPSDVQNAAETKVSEVKEGLKQEAETKVNEAKEKAEAKAQEKVDAAKAKAKEKVDGAKAKAKESINNAADKAIKGLGL